MKFMLMMQGSQAGWETMSTWTPEQFAAHVAFMRRFARKLSESGELVAAQGLDLPANAKIVRAGPGGAPAITDGPFPESKEFLAGFWIIDCESAERAIEIAAEASAAPGRDGRPMGIPIEVRQVMAGPDVEM